MDLNELLFQHQLALIRASESTGRHNCADFGLIRHYETRLAHLREDLGVAAYPRSGTQPAACA